MGRSLSSFSPQIFLVCAVILMLLFSGNTLRSEKLLVTQFTTLGVDIDDTKLEVATKLFIGELAKAKESGLNIVDVAQQCATVACAVSIGKEQNADRVVIGSINRLEAAKFFAELKVIDVEKEATVYTTHYPMVSIDNLDVVMRILARAYIEGSQAEEIAEKEEISWKKRANSMPVIRIGYSYMVGEESYQREGELERPERTFDIDLGYMYWMTNQLSIEFDLRFQLRHRGLQLLVPVYYFTNTGNISPFINIGPGFGFGPTKMDSRTDYIGSDRDGFCFVAGGGVLLFRDFNFNLILNPRYSIILNDHNDQGAGFVFGLTWAPK